MSQRKLIKVWTIIILVLLSLFSSSEISAQCSNVTYRDPQGTSNYANNLNVTTRIRGNANQQVRITFSQFVTENGFDYLYVYDDSVSTGIPIASITGNRSTTLPGPFTSTKGNLTIRFFSDGGTVAAGYTFVTSCVTICSNTTSGGTIAGAQNACTSIPSPTLLTSSAPASGGYGVLTYQWQSSPNGSTWTNISGATSLTYQPPSPLTQTTHFRRVSKRGSCTVDGAVSNVIIKEVIALPTANAGLDKNQCDNAAFLMIGNTPISGQTVSWSVISGPAVTAYPTNNDSMLYQLSSGQTATLRYTISNTACSATDDVVITNSTTGCNYSNSGAININGDLETEGNATNFPLMFQGTPAALLSGSNYVPGWADSYGTGTTNTSTFQGAYYLKKTGTAGDPYNGSHMVYINGGFCFSGVKSAINLSCGRTYKISLWAAAFTNSATQTSSDFSIETSIGGDGGVPPTVNIINRFIAPASNSWNDLNWQRYEVTFTVPSNFYEWADIYFTNNNNTSGIVIDQLIVTEVGKGSTASAGIDQSFCNNSFAMNANSPEVGYTGNWSVVSGSASIANVNSPTSSVTISSGNNATLRWTVTNGSCSSYDEVNLNYTGATAVSLNNLDVCLGNSGILTASSCTGLLLWSTGATSNSITVNPATTTTYSVTCTPPLTSNLAINGDFESTTAMQGWSNWANASITTTSGEFRSGTKGLKINAAADWGGAGQEFAVTPGQEYTVSFWAKANNINMYCKVGLNFLNSGWGDISGPEEVQIYSTTWQKYTLKGVAPLGAAYIQYFAGSSSPNFLFIDDVEVYRSNGCLSSASTNVQVNSTPIISNVTSRNRCGPGSVVLEASASIGIINWYTAATGGTIINTGTTFTTPVLSSTTIYYVDATNNGCTTTSRTPVTATIKNVPIANAGLNQTNCNNGYFPLLADTLLSGISGEWTIESGSADIYDLSEPRSHAYIFGTATLRWTVTNTQGCSAYDEITLTNNTTCASSCVGQLNVNGDLEDEGSISNFNLSLGGTPAAVCDELRIPSGWSPRYGGTFVDSTNFLGAFLVKNSNASSNPHSGENMIYMNGSYCFSSYLTSQGLACGKKYKASVWVAAYTYNSTQVVSPFNIEVVTSGTSPGFSLNIPMRAPASTSWNNLNWNRYEIEFELPEYGYKTVDLYFTSSPISGILIDDVCLTVVDNGAEAIAGDDIYQCGQNNFMLNANEPASGYTGKWIAKENNVTFSNINSPTSTAIINSGDVATLNWIVSNSTCEDTSELIVSKLNYNQFQAIGDTICSGETAIVYGKNCDGNITWASGATTPSISVTPITSTDYIASCTNYRGAELIKNANFESDLTDWNFSSGANIVTTPSLVQSGSKALRLNATTTGQYVSQDIPIQAGKAYQIRFWAKAININTPSEIFFSFKNSAWFIIGKENKISINSSTYQLYTQSFVAPPNTEIFNIGAWAQSSNIVYFDNLSLTEYSTCTSSDTAQVLVYNVPIEISNPVVGECTPNTFTSMVPVDVTVTWSSIIPGDKIRVKTGSRIKYIDVATMTSPATIRLYVPADGTLNNAISASWMSLNGAGCKATKTFNSPVPCTTTNLNCDILYLMSNYSESDAEPFDQGLSSYFASITTGTVTKAFTKNGAGLQLYDPNNRSNALSLNVDDFKLIVISASTEGLISTTLISQLRDFKGSILNMNYEMPSNLLLVTNGNEYVGLDEGYLASGEKIAPFEFNNTNPIRTTNYVFGGDIKTGGIPLLWFDNATVGTNNNAMLFRYPAHIIPGVTSNHGGRAHFGISYEGFYANYTNNGVIPAPSSSYFNPSIHLHYEVNKMLEQVIYDLAKCTPEICSNLIDDDGDGLTDCFDPDCGFIQNTEFDKNLDNWILTNTSPAVSSLLLDATTKLSGRNSARINITTAASALTNIKLTQSNIAIQNGKTYKITFRARASSNRTISSQVIDGNNPTAIYVSNNHNLLNTTTVASNTFSFTFTATTTNANASLVLNLGTALGDIYVDNIQFGEVCCLATITSVTPKIRCGSGFVTLNASSNLGTINWYAAATGGSSLGTGTNFTTPSISSTTTYYVDATNGTCTSPVRTAVTATINVCVEICSNGVDDDGDGLLDCEDPDCVESLDGEFNAGFGAWQHGVDGSVSGSITIDNTNQISGPNSAKIQINSTPGTSWLASLYQYNMSIFAGKTYVLSFTAKASVNRTMDLAVHEQIAPYTGFLYQVVNLSTTQQQYKYYFTSTVSYLDVVKIVFHLAGSPGTIWIDKVELKEACCPAAIVSTVDANRCGTGTLSLSANANLGTINWYAAATGGSSLGTGTNFTTPSISSTTTYYVDATDGSCTSDRIPVKANINLIPGSKIIQSASRCGPGSVTLLILFGAGNSNWYDAPTGGNLVGTGNSFTTPLLNTTTTYYIEGELNGCVSAIRQPITATINPLPTVTMTTDSLCQGGTITLSPTTGGTWTSSNGSIASITNAGQVTALTAGLVSFTFTNTTTNCSSNPTNNLKINPKPALNTSSAVFTLCVGGTTNISPSIGGTWSSTNPSVATISSGGVITALASGTSRFLFTSASTGCTSDASNLFTINVKPTITITGASTICQGATTTLSPTTGGTWSSNNNAVATVNNSGVVTGVSGGVAGFTFTQTSTGCPSNISSNVTVNPKPQPPLPTTNKLCVGSTLSILPSSGGTWTSSNPSVATINNSGVIQGISAGTTNMTFTSSAGCVADGSITISVGSNFSSSIDYNGSLCITNDSKLTAINTGGTAPFTYNWTGPSSFTGNTQQINISNNGNYYLTITDSYGCSNSTSGFVYSSFVPIVISLQTDVCEGESVNLNAANPSHTAYQWSDNAGNATTAAVNVTPVFPSSLYVVTITNTNNCTASASVNINVKAKPTVSVTGSSPICVGSTSSLSPTTGGTWTSNQPAIASVANNGIVTGNSEGSATFVFTNSTTNCSSNATQPIVVNAKPTISITGPSSICKGSTTIISPTTGGTWVSSNTNVATISNLGVITGVDEGTANFTFTNSITNCTSNASTNITVDDKDGAVISGDPNICIGEQTILTASKGSGTWSSSNPSVATINNSGLVTSISTGITTISYNHNSGSCPNEATFALEVLGKPTISFDGPITICEGNTTSISSPLGAGTWTSSNPSIATINNQGLITGIAAGNITFRFTSSLTNCTSDNSTQLTVNPKPIVSVNGNSNLCIGGSTSLLPNSNGTWQSSNIAVATVDNNGTVSAISNGSVLFTFTSTITGCSASLASPINIASDMITGIDYNGSPCLSATSTISALASGGASPYTFNWSGPSNFNSTLQTVNITSNGSYFLTITDSYGCTSQKSGFVYEQFQPIVIGLQPQVCEGTSLNLSAIGSNIISYLWSANAASATTAAVTVTPSLPSSIYVVTVTNNIGCTASITANVNVLAKPIINLTGSNPLCVGQTTSFTPNNGGTWTSSNSLIASIDNTGLVTALQEGSVTFSYRNSSTNCISDQSLPININNNPSISFDGPNILCIGETTSLLPNNGGTWTSNNPTIASINASGQVTTLSDGVATFSFISSNLCSSGNSAPLTVKAKPTTLLSATSICEGSTLSISPSSGGTWTSNNPTIASITNEGLVTGIAPGNASFTYIDNTGCSSDASSNLQILAKPSISISGPSTICVGGNSQLDPSSGGIWSSQNPAIATINNTGYVVGISGGITSFNYTSNTTGCTASLVNAINVKAPPIVTLNGSSQICQGNTTSFSPSTGGTWVSNHPSIASITNGGVVTGLSQGFATFKFTTSGGCPSANTQPITINAKPTTILIGNQNICIGETSQFFVSSTGTWVSSNNSVATISSTGLVTATGVGSVSFVFTDANTGCNSDATVVITVLGNQNVGLNGQSTLCVGESTSLFPSSGGTWISNNPNIASVSSNGIVSTIAPGSTTFTFTNNTSGCQFTTSSILVNARPIINFNGPTSACIGKVSSITPSSGGIWTSSQPSVASIDNNGTITALSSGNASFTFTLTSTGCTSVNSTSFVVYNNPSVSILGSQDICIGSSSSLSPISGGIWVSNNPQIASVTNSGIVTGLGVGIASFSYTESSTGCTSNLSSPITINSTPIVTLTGGNTICEGSTTTLSSNISGGSWTSSNNAVAVVSNTGLVTGISQGLASFTYTSSFGCNSGNPPTISVLGKPNIFLNGPNQVCIGNNTQMSPNVGGTWLSNNPSIANITNAGIVTGIAVGSTTFVFTDASTGCVSAASLPISVNPNPITTIAGTASICIGTNTNLLPSSGGTWQSSNPSVATISNAGLVTGINSGTVEFVYTNTQTGCSTIASQGIITVNPKPTINITGLNNICIGTNTTMSSNGEVGTWISNNPSVASITNQGIVTGLNVGVVKVQFRKTSTGCTSNLSLPITVNPKPAIQLTGPNQICINSTTNFNPSAGGTWTSNNPGVATINNNGLVTGIATGQTSFKFIETASNCSSDNSLSISVVESPIVGPLVPLEVCIGQNTQLTSSSNGTWTSLNPAIAKVSTQGEVVGITPGKTTFVFTEANTGCTSQLPSDILTVKSCIDPDFNVTLIGVEVSGDVSTNDDISGVSYSNLPALISKPIAGNGILQISSDGKYTFVGTAEGQYEYKVGVCYSTGNCTYHDLVITVVDDKDPNPKIIANTDIADSYKDSIMWINVLSNDQCISPNGDCDLLQKQWTMVDMPSHGYMHLPNANGKMKFDPHQAWIGLDTTAYKICDVGANTSKCRWAKQIVTVKHPTAKNSTVAGDDFFFVYQDSTVTGNVLQNDSDPEYNNFTIPVQRSSIQYVNGGQYTLESNGDFTFTPDPDFYGPVDIVYTICDDNSVDQTCTNATIHLLVLGDIALKVKVYLEGALIQNNNALTTLGKPMMRDNLRKSPFDDNNYIPRKNPYKIPTQHTDFTSKFETLIFGNKEAFDEILDSTAVFSVEGDNAIVDWIFLEIRDKNDSTSIISSRAALIQRDGDVVDIDGISKVRFPGVSLDSMYLVVRHRNHLGVMSKLVSPNQLIDFTSLSTPIFDFGLQSSGLDYTNMATNNEVKFGYRALWAGDFDTNGRLKFTNPGDDQNILFFDVFANPDNITGNANFNNAYGYYQGDFNMNSKSKYDNPDDDKNLLFSQILLFPLNVGYLSNFNFIIEQIPSSNR